MLNIISAEDRLKVKKTWSQNQLNFINGNEWCRQDHFCNVKYYISTFLTGLCSWT